MAPGGTGPTARVARPLAAALLVILPLALPFETPLFHLGPLVVTSAELALYALLAAWLAQASPRRLRDDIRDPMVQAVVLWMAAVVASALLAPAQRGPALKFALRAAGGALVFFAARDLARARAVQRWTALAVVVGAALAAALAVVEVTVPGGGQLLQPFHAQSFTALGVTRASGTFAYPTQAAMYWEAALPLCALFLAGDRPRPVTAVGGGVAAALAGLLVAAIVLSATRAAVAGAFFGGGALLVLGWRAGPPMRIAGAGMLAVTAVALAVLVVVGGGSGSLLGQRLHAFDDRAWFAARYTVEAVPRRATAGRAFTAGLTVENAGTLAWPHAGNDAVHLSYHWEIADGAGWRLVDFDGWRTPLPADVAPGARVRLAADILAPARPGRYLLRWDLVRETVTWFSERGVPTADVVVDVEAADGAASAPAGAAAPPGRLEDAIARPTPGRPELWRAALALWLRHPILGVGPDNFRHLYPGVLVAPEGERLFADPRLHANSLYLETLADLGLVGALALAWLVLALVRALRAHVTRGEIVSLACGIAAGTFFVHGLVDTFLAFTPLYGLHWLLLGLTARTDRIP